MNLYEKLEKIERLIEQGASEAEKQAARQAKERLSKRLDKEAPESYKIMAPSLWEKELFVAICQKYGYETFRYRGQKYTTSNIKVAKSVMDTILWPEYEKFAVILREAMEDVTSDLIARIHRSKKEETVLSRRKN
jgi:aminopeptidase C